MYRKKKEYNGLEGTFLGLIFSFACTPLDHGLSLEETHIFQFLHCWFRHFALASARWKIGNCFVFNFGLVFLGSHLKVTSLRSGATRGAEDVTGSWKMWIWIRRRPEVNRVKTLRSYQTALYGLCWQFCEYLEDQRIFPFLGKFYHTFCHEFLILKSKLKGFKFKTRGFWDIYIRDLFFKFFGK